MAQDGMSKWKQNAGRTQNKFELPQEILERIVRSKVCSVLTNSTAVEVGSWFGGQSVNLIARTVLFGIPRFGFTPKTDLVSFTNAGAPPTWFITFPPSGFLCALCLSCASKSVLQQTSRSATGHENQQLLLLEQCALVRKMWIQECRKVRSLPQSTSNPQIDVF